ncbi:hypothetical protein Aros01_05294 [Streptosporangium roseum]
MTEKTPAAPTWSGSSPAPARSSASPVRFSAEQTDGWTGARSMGLDVLAEARMRVITGDTPQHAPLPQTPTA